MSPLPGAKEEGLVITTTETFADLGVHADIVEALERVNIVHPFPIQALALPIALAGTDMIGQARTGTGKTLAFGIATLQRLHIMGEEGYGQLKKPGAPQALVMCPTRELALQVAKDLQTASTVRKARVLTVYGGVSYDAQLSALKEGVDVVVGTPGRLLDLVQRRSLDLSHVGMVVLDEADEMLDLGFLPDVERLLSHTPKSRQTLLFSATMPTAIVSLARTHLTQPVNVRAEAHHASTTVPDTTQFVYQAHDLDKPEMIGKILQSAECDKVMIFCRTKRSAQRLSEDLVERGFDAAAIHGDLNQAMREKALKRFRDNKLRILVATDVAARGIDVTGVSHVINYECPDDDKSYVHRIGRTGRAGAKGIAITFVDWADLVRWKTINAALNLDFSDPQETYSTSAHLLSDQNIAEGTRSRIAEAKAHDETDDSEALTVEERRARREARRGTRSRSRLRNGKPTEANGTAPSAPQEKRPRNGDSAPAAASSTAEAPAERTGRSRRRRRRPAGERPSAPANVD